MPSPARSAPRRWTASRAPASARSPLSSSCLVLQRTEPADGAPLARQIPRRDVGHLRRRDRRKTGRHLFEVAGAGDGLEVAELVRHVRDAVALEHEARAQLALRPRDLFLAEALLADALDLQRRGGFEIGQL